MASGESHYFLGLRYRLRVHETTEPTRITLLGKASMNLFVRLGTPVESREQVLHDFYRAEMKCLVSELLEKWQPKLGIEARLGYQADEDQRGTWIIPVKT